MLVTIQETTWCHKPKMHDQNFHSRNNLITEITIQRHTQTIHTMNRNLFIPEMDLATNLLCDTN
jgi:hypothetical protein